MLRLGRRCSFGPRQHRGHHHWHGSSNARKYAAGGERWSAATAARIGGMASSATTSGDGGGGGAAAAAAAAVAGGGGSLDEVAQRVDQSFLRELKEDPMAAKHAPNRTSRQVHQGHYVRVRPLPLRQARLVMYSRSMAAALGVSDSEVQSQRFIDYFAGDTEQLPAMGEPWATPYALSIMGERLYHNCPFGNGNGYGDGRAISLTEVIGADKQRWELQAKGAGPTPFCRGADGRAVLRSSIREFLASEAMHALGVPTTRALVLVVSGVDTVRRPWYSHIGEDDPRLQRFSRQERQRLLQQKRDPDTMIDEKCAISTRVAPSFIRVGHFDLFARRAEKPDASDEQKQQLRDLLVHAIRRDFATEISPLPEAPNTGNFNDASISTLATKLLDAFGDRLVAMVAGWMRVGFCQGNFNADNCLVSGKTMDYGPFGFMDNFDPLFAKWVGSGEHFAFMNQPAAALANFHTMATSLSSFLDAAAVTTSKQKVQQSMFDAIHNVWKAKLGFDVTITSDEIDSSSSSLWRRLQPLLKTAKADFTIFFRQLIAVVEDNSGSGGGGGGSDTTTTTSTDSTIADKIDTMSVKEMKAALKAADVPHLHCVEKQELVKLLIEVKLKQREGDLLLSQLEDVFYEPLDGDAAAEFRAWLQDYRAALLHHGKEESDAARLAAAAARMKTVNPYYIPREWMLVKAYDDAKRGDYKVLLELQKLFENPYCSQSPLMLEKYYRRAPDDALRTGGVAFMS